MKPVNRLRTAFEIYSVIPDSEWAAFVGILKTKSVSPGRNFVNLGDLDHNIGYVITGLFKVCYV